MQPLQRLYDSLGNEVILFPMADLYLSTARDPAEHDLYAMDFFGWDNGLRIYDCPCYAPCSCEVVYTGNDHNMICWSLNPVRLIDGTLSHVSILVAHSDTAPASVGSRFVQGQLWYHTGNFGQSTGDHLHIEIALGHVTWDTGGTHLENPAHLYDVLACNNTTISRGMDYNWRNYEGGLSYHKRKHEFPWVLYANKLRNIPYKK